MNTIIIACCIAFILAICGLVIAIILKRRRLRTANEEEYEVNEFALNAEMDAEIRRLNEAA